MSSPTNPNAAEVQNGEAAPKKSLLAKINVLLFLAAVIVAECLIAYLYLPTAPAAAAGAVAPPPAEKTTADKEPEKEKNGHGKEAKEPAKKESAKHEKAEKASAHGKTEKHGSKHGDSAMAEEAEPADPPETLEVDLGEFSITVYQPVSNSTLRIDFHLFGTVPGEQGKEFAKLFDETKHRFRDQVLMIIRSAEMSDLTDAGLGLIKRRIQDRANKLLGRPLLQSVIISDFAFVEQ